MPHPLLKICCIKTPAEAALALQAGADFLGFVSEMPDGPGVISLKEITDIIQGLPPETGSVLLTSKTRTDEISSQLKRVNSWGVQIVSPVSPNTLIGLRELHPEIHIIQVVHVQDHSALEVARSYYDLADYLLLDSGIPTSDSPSLGGTGRTHDWELSRIICGESPVPVLLAGGINSENVVQALQLVSPAGVDLCSGLRSGDQLDAEKLHCFISAFHSYTDLKDHERGS